MKDEKLVLFDLDNTLIPIDSDYHWVNFIADNNFADCDSKKIKETNEELMNLYNNNKLTAEKTANFMLGLLSSIDPIKLAELHEIYMLKIIRPVIKDNAIRLVKSHLENDDRCAIVTATNEFVTAPIARAFGIQNLIATKPEYVKGSYTGKIEGMINFKEGKIINVNNWLKQFNKTINDFRVSFFYSDSINDLPLLEKVTNPIATNPSEELLNIAIKRGWQVINLFDNKNQQ